MKRETVLQLSVALLAFTALGVSATTIESTLTTDANDVIDLDYDQVPIGQDDASALVDEIEGGNSDGDATSSADADAAESSASNAPRPDGSQADATGASGAGETSQAQSQQQRQQESTGTTPVLPSLLDRLLALLTALLPYMVALAVLLAAAGLAVRYRERLRALLDDADPDDGSGGSPATETDPFDGPHAHAVERAWAGMVRHLDLERPETATTSECARAAVDAGLDGEAVRTLTETYEEVRYGGRPVTEQRQRVAKRSQRRFDDGGER